ncbi:putative Coiled-coil domain-containing protein [Plasmopara halstedii]
MTLVANLLETPTVSWPPRQTEHDGLINKSNGAALSDFCIYFFCNVDLCITIAVAHFVKWCRLYMNHKQTARLQSLGNTKTGATQDWCRCIFCDVTLATTDAPAHFSSKKHRNKVESFCRHHHCDADRQMRTQLCLTASKRRQFERRRRNYNERVDAFSSSATSRLQDAESQGQKVMEVAMRIDQQNSPHDLQSLPVSVTNSCKIVSRSKEILHNKGEWASRDVKIRKRDCTPWAINQATKEGHLDQPQLQRMGQCNAINVHRVTQLVQGKGLSSIAAVSWGSSVRNIHTAAVPPWLVQSEEEYKQCNQKQQVATEKNDQVKRKDIFSERFAKAEYDSDWLPNFGGVWQEGSRLKTKQAFRKAVNNSKALRSRALSPPPVAPAVLSQHMPSKIKSPPFLQSHSSVSIRTENLSTKQSKISRIMPIQSSQTEIIKPQLFSADTKKQLLLAQKERLRAKMKASKKK